MRKVKGVGAMKTMATTISMHHVDFFFQSVVGPYDERMKSIDVFESGLVHLSAEGAINAIRLKEEEESKLDPSILFNRQIHGEWTLSYRAAMAKGMGPVEAVRYIAQNAVDSMLTDRVDSSAASLSTSSSSPSSSSSSSSSRTLQHHLNFIREEIGKHDHHVSISIEKQAKLAVYCNRQLKVKMAEPHNLLLYQQTRGRWVAQYRKLISSGRSEVVAALDPSLPTLLTTSSLLRRGERDNLSSPPSKKSRN